MRAILVSGMLAAGLLAGCGGVASDVEEPSLESREDALFYCGNERFVYTYYSDASHTTVVGTVTCRCWQMSRTTGTTSSYWTQTGYAICPGDPP